ncbi:MAG: HEAT repeat domain-containing protein [Candidatus Zixiibacteriota bacterium]
MRDTSTRVVELLAGLQSPEFTTRELAVRELATYAQDEALAGLVLALEDPDLGIRELAADSLVRANRPTVSHLLIRFLEHQDIGTRNLASEILVRIGREAVPALLANITVDDHDVRKFVVDVLGLIGDPQAVEALCDRLGDANSNVACSAAEALGEIRDNRAVPHLMAAFETREEIRLSVVEALGKIGTSETLHQLYAGLVADDPVLLFAVIDAIGQIGLADSVPHLLPFLDHKDQSIAEAALAAVVRIHARNRGAVECDIPLERFLAAVLEGMRNGDQAMIDFALMRPSWWLSAASLAGLVDAIPFLPEENHHRLSELLSGLGQPAIEVFFDRLRGAAPEAKIVLLDIVKEIVDDSVAAMLVPVADDTDPGVRRKVAQVLGISGFNGAVTTLKRLAMDANGHVRSAAFFSLGWLCSEQDVDFIFSGLDDVYRDVREAALGALIVIGGPRVVAKFTADLYHENAERQRLAVSALGMIGEADVVDPLIKAINHPEATVRQSAINALARLGPVCDPEPIRVALNDENSSVRKAAISALVALCGRVAVRDIKCLLDDEDVWVRYHAINALAELRDPSLAALVLPYLTDSQDIVKIAVIKGLAQMRAIDALPALHSLRSDTNKDVETAIGMAVSTLEGADHV